MDIKTTRFTSEDLQRAAERIQQPRWANCRDALVKRAEAFYTKGVVIPEFDASWYNPETPYRETYTEFHGYIFGHRELFQELRFLVHAGIVLGNDDWRRQALEFALGIAEAIDFRITHYDSGMEFGSMACTLCDCYLGANDLLDDPTRQRVLTQLRHAADAILRCREIWQTELKNMPFNNHRMCHMSNLLALGYVLGDDSLVDPTFDPTDERSFASYLNGAVYDDGLCYESSSHYHFATTGFLLSTARTQRALFPERADLFCLHGAYGRTLEDYVKGPIPTTFRGLEMPRVGDCYGQSTVIGDSPIFAIAYAVYGNPLYGHLAHESETKHPLESLAYAPETSPAVTIPEATSRIFPEHGYALLRDDTCLHKQALLAGDRSGIHHQRDGLQLQVMLGDEMALYCTDITPTAQHGFSDNIHESFNRWAHAHSQLTVDDLDQKTCTSPIPIREWNADGAIKRMAMVDEHADLQDGVHQGRFVSMSQDWVCDCVIAAATEERTWRQFFHLPQGAPEPGDEQQPGFKADLAKPLPDKNPWRFFQVDGGAPAQPFHSLQSGQTSFMIRGSQDIELQRFTIPIFQAGRVGLWAEQRGQYAVFITLMSQNSATMVSNVSVEEYGNELIARWLVQGEHDTWLQARILRPNLG